MVVKLQGLLRFISFQFESRVILDGSQTRCLVWRLRSGFESRVILDGSQTLDLYT